jgi:GNAT superfamily N-acetyltransferase
MLDRVCSYLNGNQKTILLSSMFTLPNYRRKGIAKELLSKVVEEARNFGCATVQITASDMAFYSIRILGFEKNSNFIQFQGRFLSGEAKMQYAR